MAIKSLLQKRYRLSGISLIQLIIYIALSATALVIIVQTSLNVILGDVHIHAEQEVFYNARLVSNQFQLKVKAADDIITGSSTFDINPGVLTLDYPGTDDVIFDTYQKTVSIGGKETTITKLRIKEGTAAYVDLTSDKVDVTNFTLINLTRDTEPKNVNIALTIERANPGNDPKFDASIDLDTSISVHR